MVPRVLFSGQRMHVMRLGVETLQVYHDRDRRREALGVVFREGGLNMNCPVARNKGTMLFPTITERIGRYMPLRALWIVYRKLPEAHKMVFMFTWYELAVVTATRPVGIDVSTMDVYPPVVWIEWTDIAVASAADAEAYSEKFTSSGIDELENNGNDTS